MAEISRAFTDGGGEFTSGRGLHKRQLRKPGSAGLSGRLEGEAAWQPDGTGLTQIETGLPRYGDAAPMQATPRYLWGEGAGVLRVYFDDGRPFAREPAMRPMPAISACLTYMTCGTI